MVDQNCLFCRIVKGEIPAKKVYEDSGSIAFLDINPRNPGHTLLIPKRHCETIFEMAEEDGARLFSSLKKVASMVKAGVNAHGLSICQNNGPAAGQVVGHVHFHIIPRFLNEGPAALEAFLPIRKMDEKSLDKVLATIRSSRIEQPAEMPVRRKVEGKKEESEQERKHERHENKKHLLEDEDDDDDLEELEFHL